MRTGMLRWWIGRIGWRRRRGRRVGKTFPDGGPEGEVRIVWMLLCLQFVTPSPDLVQLCLRLVGLLLQIFLMSAKRFHPSIDHALGRCLESSCLLLLQGGKHELAIHVPLNFWMECSEVEFRYGTVVVERNRVVKIGSVRKELATVRRESVTVDEQETFDDLVPMDVVS